MNLRVIKKNAGQQHLNYWSKNGAMLQEVDVFYEERILIVEISNKICRRNKSSITNYVRANTIIVQS